jgi:hypothetical protein
VHGELLPALPRALHDRGATHVSHLFDHVQFTQSIETFILIVDLHE